MFIGQPNRLTSQGRFPVEGSPSEFTHIVALVYM